MKTALNWLAFVIVVVTIILVYGCWPRKPEPEIIDVETTVVQQDLGFFADNFDYAYEELDRALDVIQIVENRTGDTNAVGDTGLVHKAYGLYQIRQPYLDDVNRIVGPYAMRELWGKDELTIDDMKDTKKARWVARKYLEYYGRLYEQRTGRQITIGVYARIHNGGPYGWTKSSTNSYLKKIEGELK